MNSALKYSFFLFGATSFALVCAFFATYMPQIGVSLAFTIPVFLAFFRWPKLCIYVIAITFMFYEVDLRTPIGFISLYDVASVVALITWILRHFIHHESIRIPEK